MEHASPNPMPHAWYKKIANFKMSHQLNEGDKKRFGDAVDRYTHQYSDSNRSTISDVKNFANFDKDEMIEFCHYFCPRKGSTITAGVMWRPDCCEKGYIGLHCDDAKKMSAVGTKDIRNIAAVMFASLECGVHPHAAWELEEIAGVRRFHDTIQYDSTWIDAHDEYDNYRTQLFPDNPTPEEQKIIRYWKDARENFCKSNLRHLYVTGPKKYSNDQDYQDLYIYFSHVWEDAKVAYTNPWGKWRPGFLDKGGSKIINVEIIRHIC